MTTKTISGTKPKQDRATGLKPEYRFDYTKAQPNRFASRVPGASLAVLLDPDVARVFQDAESVNTVLRALLVTMPARDLSQVPNPRHNPYQKTSLPKSTPSNNPTLKKLKPSATV